jgi:alkylation response protein AidB-like acyl-CoA dehydrogenase
MLLEHYKPNLRDIFFHLFEVFEIQKTTLGRGPFANMDEAAARESLKATETLALNELQKSYVESDRVPLELDGKGNVTLPPGLSRGYRAFYEAGAHLLNLPEHMGGMGAPPSVAWSAFELVSGANAPLTFYLFGNFTARTIDRHGTEEQKRRFIGPILERHWSGSMVLTEPEAGSDVGAGRTKARQIEGNLYELTGEKRFITNGDFDTPENIVHLVLARPEGAGGGTKGLSLFIVPKLWVNEDGSIGDRNGVFVTKIEKKMGIKGSATAELLFGDGIPARGLLLGGVHDGIRQMFHIIEQARMGVGVKSMATLSTAYLNALDYARERTQGPDLLRAADKSSPRVKIVRHPDVRRMLMSQKSHAEGMRALCLYTAWVQDQVELLGGHGSKEADSMDKLNDMLLPLVKGFCSERATVELGQSLQTYGGSGYIQDFPIEQYLRDQKIDSLYEGTTHIQALDLFFRKIAKDGGATLMSLIGQIDQFLASNPGGADLAGERKLLGDAVADLRAIFGAMMGKVGESLYHVGFQGNRILFALAEVVVGWLLLRGASVALEAGTRRPEEASFYAGKVASARFFCKNVLPNVGLTRRLVEESTLELMDLPDEAFG